MRVSGFLAGLWGFVVGDDWRTALGVVLALSATAVLAAAGFTAWWATPPIVLALLALSVRRAARGASPLAGPPAPPPRVVNEGAGARAHVSERT